MTRPWWKGPMLGLDLETTGVDVETARIVTAAVCVVGCGEPRTRTWLADPGVEIPDEAAAIHGVTTERAQAEGAPPEEVVADILLDVGAAITDGRPIVVFNAPFDLTILDREARRWCAEDGQSIDWSGLLVIDPLVIDKWLDRFRKGSRKLDAICAAYGATLDGAHDAGNDALAACRAAFVLGARGQVIRNIRSYRRTQDTRELAALQAEWSSVQDDLQRLHDAQAKWARHEALRLADYFRAQGQHEDAAGVRPNWPIVPHTATQTFVQ